MPNLILKTIIMTALACLSASVTLAQSPFDFTSSKNTSTLAQSTTSKPTVLSTSDFKNAVSKMSQETKNSLNQQAAQQFLKQPQNQPASVPPPVLPSTQTTTVPPISSPENTATPPPPYSSGTGNIAVSPVLTAPPVTPILPPAPVTPLPSQNQTYTGFGTGNTNNKSSGTPASDTSGSGGWNIKY